MSHTIQWLRRKRVGAVPDQPLPPVATNVTANGATLTWVREPGQTFATLERDVSPDFIGPTTVYSGNDLLSVDDTGLTVSTLYYYRLIVSNRFGDSDPSDSTIVTLDTPSPPATPAAPTIDAHSITTVSLSWPAVATATAYTLQRSVTSGSGFSTIYGPGPNLAFVDSGLTGATTYYYRLSATNADGTSAYSPEASQATDGNPTPPDTPGQPTASNVTSSSAQIAWTAVAGATDYEVQRRQTAPSTTAFATVFGPAPQTSFLSTGMNASSTYEFKVRASNSAGTSAYSVVRTITTGGTTGTNIQPVSILELRKNSGVAGHPNFGAGTVFDPANAPKIVDLIADAGFGFMRGQFANEDKYLPRMQVRGLKWICGVVPEASRDGSLAPPTDQTVAQTRAKVRDLRENPAAVATVVGIEGINEPNDNRGSGGVVANWADITVDHQRAIWQEAKWNLTSVGGPIGSSPTAGSVLNPLRNVTIYGPSLHDIATENSYKNPATASGGPRHWHQLLDLGILGLQQAAGFHCYPGAGIPLRGARNRALLGPESESGNITGRLELMWSAYGDAYPSYTTEWGYTNSLGQGARGHFSIDERGAGIYAPRGFIQMYTQPYQIGGRGLLNNTACTWFEALDDKNDAHDSQEANFGIMGYVQGTDAKNPANWRQKPQYVSCKNFFTHFAQENLDGADYVPARIFCTVTTTASNDLLEWQFFSDRTQSAAGTSTIAIYRNMRVWDRDAQTPINVPTIPVTITDRVGPRTIQVGAPVTLLDLR